MTSFYAWLARSSLRHRWKLLGTWVVILGLAAFGAARVSHALSVGGFSLPGTEFHAASTILARDLHLSPDKTALVVYHSDRLWVTDEEYYQAVEDSLRSLSADEFVSKTESFYKTGIPDWVSPDNRTTYAWVRLQGSEKELEEATPRLRHRAASDVLQVYLIGQPAANYDIETASTQDLLRVERITFPIIFVVLVLVFRSVVAAVIPLLLGMVSVCVSLAFLYLLAQMTEVSIFALNTASMIGLGLAVDFSLILVSRYREELADRPMPEALEIMLRTSGRSITFSGVTLMLTMAVLILFPVMVINSIALAITIVAAVAVLTALLLLPALLVVLGPHLNRLSVAPLLSWASRGEGGRWGTWAHAVMRWPWLSTVAALALLALMAAPALKLKRSGVTAQVLPQESVSRQGVELIQRQFGPGEAAPLFVVVEASRPGGLWQPEILEGVYDLHAHLEKDPRVARVTSLATLIPNPTGEWMQSLSPATINSNPDRGRIAERLANLDGTNQTTLLVVYPHQNETHPETVELMLDLRRNAKVWASGLSATRLLVGGTPAQHYDFDRVVYDQFPLLLTLSLFVTFVILMLFFHSLILPVKAILLNVVSLVASYGVLVLVFQFGVLDSLLGFHSLGAILSYTPVLLFSILFGLSTDYEVFLLTRVREYVRQGYSNEASVALGLERTASIITAAGLIMIAVFGSFALTRVLVIKELGFGLAVAVFLDTTLVRIVLVPATMKLMGRWNWWMPRPLDRLMPELDEEIAPPLKQAVPRPVESAALVPGGKG